MDAGLLVVSDCTLWQCPLQIHTCFAVTFAPFACLRLKRGALSRQISQSVTPYLVIKSPLAGVQALGNLAPGRALNVNGGLEHAFLDLLKSGVIGYATLR